MIPILQQYFSGVSINLLLKKDIKISDFIEEYRDNEKIYKLKTGIYNKYLTSDEFIIFKNCLEQEIDLNIYNFEEDNNKNTGYIKICNIQIPQEWYLRESSVIGNPNNYKTGEFYYNFQDCRDYFITSCENFFYMTLLINDAINKGYRLIFRDPQHLIVEMSKSKLIGI